jgi:hypothetical protein
MRIDGLWFPFDDGELRPVVLAQLVASDGSLVETLLLVDTGADRTVLTRAVLDALGLPATQPVERMAGVGGVVGTVQIATELRLGREDGRRVSFRGRFSAVTDAGALDLGVLGRDIIGLFALIVDRPGNVVCLIGQQHRYSISST